MSLQHDSFLKQVVFVISRSPVLSLINKMENEDFNRRKTESIIESNKLLLWSSFYIYFFPIFYSHIVVTRPCCAHSLVIFFPLEILTQLSRQEGFKHEPTFGTLHSISHVGVRFMYRS